MKRGANMYSHSQLHLFSRRDQQDDGTELSRETPPDFIVPHNSQSSLLPAVSPFETVAYPSALLAPTVHPFNLDLPAALTVELQPARVISPAPAAISEEKKNGKGGAQKTNKRKRTSDSDSAVKVEPPTLPPAKKQQKKPRKGSLQDLHDTIAKLTEERDGLKNRLAASTEYRLHQADVTALQGTISGLQAQITNKDQLIGERDERIADLEKQLKQRNSSSLTSPTSSGYFSGGIGNVSSQTPSSTLNGDDDPLSPTGLPRLEEDDEFYKSYTATTTYTSPLQSYHASTSPVFPFFTPPFKGRRLDAANTTLADSKDETVKDEAGRTNDSGCPFLS
jgi:hypothetical protein